MLPFALGAFVLLSVAGAAYGAGYDAGRAWRASRRRPVLRQSTDGLPFVEWVERER